MQNDQQSDVELLWPQPGAVVVELLGEHDLVTKSAMSDLLEGLVSDYDLVVIDVSRAEFIDSSFLHLLV